jgi:hypothetical protein
MKAIMNNRMKPLLGRSSSLLMTGAVRRGQVLLLMLPSARAGVDLHIVHESHECFSVVWAASVADAERRFASAHGPSPGPSY